MPSKPGNKKKGYVASKKKAKKGGITKPKGAAKKAKSAANKGGKKAKAKATIGCSDLTKTEISTLAKKYAKLTNANKPFTWNQIKPGLKPNARSMIRGVADAAGLIVKGKKDKKQDYATTPPPPPPPFVIFPKKFIKATFTLPKSQFKDSDPAQFSWLNKQMKAADKSYNSKKKTFGTDPTQYTWHHAQSPPGTMQLVEFGIHNRTNHAGGRNVWGGGTGSR